MSAAGTPERLDLEPVGTGPFQLQAYQKDAVIRYQAHPEYWEGKAALDNLVFAITPDASVRWQKLQAGECHVIPYPNPADLEAMRNHPDVQVLEQEGLNVGYLGFNTEKEPFTDARVRQCAQPRGEQGSDHRRSVPGRRPGRQEPVAAHLVVLQRQGRGLLYDPERAKQPLGEAGVTNLSTNIWAMPVQRPYNPNARRMAELIQADWAEVGVQAEIVSFEWGEYLKRSQAGEHQTLLLGWTADIADPDNFLGVLLSCAAAKDGTNRARWCHQPFDQLITQAVRINDEASGPSCTSRRR